MTTVLLYLFFAAVIGLAVFAIAVLIFGRGEQMAALSPRISPAELPDDGVTADDVRGIRFSMAVRGYRMSDVDWTLERLAEELTVLRTEIGELKGIPLQDDAWTPAYAGVSAGSGRSAGPAATSSVVAEPVAVSLPSAPGSDPEVRDTRTELPTGPIASTRADPPARNDGRSRTDGPAGTDGPARNDPPTVVPRVGPPVAPVAVPSRLQVGDLPQLAWPAQPSAVPSAAGSADETVAHPDATAAGTADPSTDDAGRGGS